jgi:hypothetical protein
MILRANSEHSDPALTLQGSIGGTDGGCGGGKIERLGCCSLAGKNRVQRRHREASGGGFKSDLGSGMTSGNLFCSLSEGDVSRSQGSRVKECRPGSQVRVSKAMHVWRGYVHPRITDAVPFLVICAIQQTTFALCVRCSHSGAITIVEEGTHQIR